MHLFMSDKTNQKVLSIPDYFGLAIPKPTLKMQINIYKIQSLWANINMEKVGIPHDVARHFRHLMMKQ